MPLNVAATADAYTAKMQMRLVARPVSLINRFYRRAAIYTGCRHHTLDPSFQREKSALNQRHSPNESADRGRRDREEPTDPAFFAMTRARRRRPAASFHFHLTPAAGEYQQPLDKVGVEERNRNRRSSPRNRPRPLPVTAGPSSAAGSLLLLRQTVVFNSLVAPIRPDMIAARTLSHPASAATTIRVGCKWDRPNRPAATFPIISHYLATSGTHFTTMLVGACRSGAARAASVPGLELSS